ncbi:MAG: hypothetical protein V7L04_24300 [Nostoc sp.]|uniref:hypothetical protein n=1 Tax=Nostoc sp. TaxID=1180 RepID=UPI002FF492C5
MGLGTRKGGQGRQGDKENKHTQCPMPNAQCPIPADCRQLAQKPSILERSL